MKVYVNAILAFLTGAGFLCFFSFLQKKMAGVSFQIENFLIPFLIGGLVGLLFFLRERRLRKEIKFRIQTEEKLLESEERQRTIVESLGVGIMIIDPSEHKIVQVNREAARMVGLAPGDILDKICHQFICPAEKGKCPISDLEKNIDNSERLLLTADGNEIPIVKSVISIQLNGREHYLEGFIDLSKRKEAENELRKTVERFKSLTKHLNVGYFRNTAGRKGKFVEVNTSTCRMLGYDHKEELLKKPVFDFYQDPTNRKKISDKILQKGVIKNEIIRLKRKDGSLFIGSLSAAAVKNGKDDISYFDGIIEDVTEREHISEKLRKSEKRYKELFNSITDLVYTQDLEGRFTSANNALHQLFGYNLEEFIGRRTTEFMEPEHTAKFKPKYLDKIKKDGSYEGVSSYLKKDGEKIYLEYRSSLVLPEDGEPYISGIARDVTERILAERKIRDLQNQMLQVQKMEAIGTLAGGIAHDFNNILSAVIGYTELSLLDVEKESKLHRNLTEVLKAGRRASDLVKQILTFSRQSKQETKAVHLNQLVQEALKMLRSTIPTSVEIRENIDTDLLTIRAEPTHVHQVVVNLVANAAQAVNEEVGLIEISITPFSKTTATNDGPSGMAIGKYAKLTVRDNGEGISKKDISHIFEPYFTTKEQQKGTGLGLAVVHGIIETYNGYITVSSEIHIGTTFEIYLPLALRVGVERATRWTGPLPAGDERILFVDDESSIVDIHKQILKKLGYNVTGRTCSTEALETFRATPDKFDLVITDMTMPKMSGKSLTQKLKKIRPDIPVILCTGFSEKLSDPKASEADFDGFLLKPVDRAKMALTIRKVLKVTPPKPDLAEMALRM